MYCGSTNNISLIMARLYYTCPIKAAYMSEYFGVEMSYLFCDADSWQEYKSTERLGAFEIDKYFSEDRATLDGRIWVSDEWNDFFEPKEDDVFSYKMFGQIKTYILPEHQDGKEWAKECSEIKVIMRDNKQFFMPEGEDEKL